ncbi:pleckstrin homology domain-containing family G member 5-like isoform X2 [Contarinia nasturtii]|uniref:pleckstrin homology domain-containing family G member 5-like isoform X2 n=1 Tax=Contarinia nasturtii TaxID=265458 RepID=UPI0012D39B54|nr:pleckstrin homology domain-containing family G member 5-like isoform X2 [Contarinia nasturtii]XP_031617992.1 pleckstrin homology domain-containing family G member 5-like isoform X2 [Contarinia nasturtii]XP_031617993.1 pleckstrin homology domain-containing family G member 5-like isoform X2 [Contarinia nasturtii]
MSTNTNNVWKRLNAKNPFRTIETESTTVQLPPTQQPIKSHTQQSSFATPQYTNNPFLDERSCITEMNKEPIESINDYRNGTSGPDNNKNDVNIIDYTTNKIHQSKIESPIPTSPSSSLFVRNKNPFSISEMKHSDESTQSPMKICLVVSPPTNKLLQLKSKSLTHLDSLEPHNLMQNSVFPSQQTEVNHSNFFRIYFDVNAVSEKEEILPAVKGATLGHVLSESLLRRNLSISQLAIHELPGTSDLKIPLTQLNHVNDKTDTGQLAGKYLIITEQDGVKLYHPSLQKVPSLQSDGPRPMRLYSSVSAEEATESSHIFDSVKSNLITTKPSKPRWSTLFGQKNPQQGQLCEILNSYAKNGVPQSKTFSSFEHTDLASSLHYMNNIHGSWKEFVNESNMKEHEIKIQSAIWELVSTEVDYIHALQTVTELFLSCLEAIQSHKILTDIDQSKLFLNIREIYEVNIKFWTLYLYPMVQNSIKTGAKMCIDFFRPAFENFPKIFSPYKIYCAEQSTCQYYCRDLNGSNTLFTSYLAWCEAQKLCNRLRLADILVRPTQRLTKYGLLLGAMRKNVVDENDAESLDLMIHCVESFVFGVNVHLTMRQENERLKGIMARIESYDVVDTNNENMEKLLKQHCTMFDLCGPMIGVAQPNGRHLFMEGDLRYKDSTTKVDVHCFLLTDLLLICKKKGMGNLKVIRQPYFTDRLKIQIKDSTLYLIYLNEWDLAISAFTLHCSDVARNWFDALTKTKHIYSRLKQSSPFDSYNIRYSTETLGVRKSPLNSTMGSRLSSLNNSHSGSVELNDSRNISMDYEKASSLSSDESMQMGSATVVQGGSNVPTTSKKLLQYTPSTKYRGTTPNTLLIQPFVHLGQSLPNLNLNVSQTSANNTLLVPGTSSGHSNLLSPSQRGISYPPPSPTRAILRRGFAFSQSIKNPPLIKSRNIQSQCSVTANVPIPLIGTGGCGGKTPETTAQIKDTSKLQYHHTSITGPTKHTQVQQKLSNESIDLTYSNQNQQSKNEHIV